jgi:hypothetical protein
MLGKYRRGAPAYGRATGGPSAEARSEEMAIVDAWACCMLVCVFREFAKAYKAAKRCRHFKNDCRFFFVFGRVGQAVLFNFNLKIKRG